MNRKSINFSLETSKPKQFIDGNHQFTEEYYNFCMQNPNIPGSLLQLFQDVSVIPDRISSDLSASNDLISLPEGTVFFVIEVTNTLNVRIVTANTIYRASGLILARANIIYPE